MPNKISIEEVEKRLQLIHKNELLIVPHTYACLHKKAKFILKDGTEWWAIVKNVLNGTKGPKITITQDILISRIKKVHGDIVEIDTSTFINDRTKARFIDKDFGEWWAFPKNVYALGNSHPKRGNIKRKNTCLQKYGSENPTGNLEVKLKRDRNNIGKYGIAHTMQVPEFALRSAKSNNNASIKIHWKTNEELVCQGSYESRVVEYLNSNKIDYLWQHKTFLMPNNRTYRPDLFLINENLWVEIKGYFRKDAREKWDWFHSEYLNSEVWDKKKLKEMDIL